MAPTKQNGARAKILRALAEFGMLPVSELAAASCLHVSQARDNANHAVNDGLATKGRDDVTNSLAYKITAAGRAYLAGICLKAEKELSEAGPAQENPPVETLEQFLRKDMELAAARWAADIGPAFVAPVASPAVADAKNSGGGSPAEQPGQSEMSISVDAIHATDPAPAPEQYAICRVGQVPLSALPLREMTIEAAKQLAIDDATATGGEVILCRCSPIGRAMPVVVFESFELGDTT